jgi:hypothetical protein
MIKQFHDRSKGLPVTSSVSNTLVFVYIDEFRKLRKTISPAQVSEVLSSIGGLISGNQFTNVLITTLEQMVLMNESMPRYVLFSSIAQH